MPSKGSNETTDRPTRTPASTRVVYSNPWITVHEDQTITSDGQTGVYSYVESNNSCMIVAVNKKDEIYLVRNFRYPSKTYGWELPGGGNDGEDPITACQRELEEETGILASSWQELGEAIVCNGLMSEKIAICLAKNLNFNGIKETSDEKFIDMRFFSPAEVDAMILNGEINDCQTITGLHYYHTHRNLNGIV